jgi:uncharacterized membrane protein YraQ (UPF0718 family)
MPYKRFSLILLSVIALVTWFATTSRVPAINQKASSAGVLENSGKLSFDPVLELRGGEPYWQRVAYSSVNWANTNKKGMAFGICLASLLLPLLGLVAPRLSRNRYLGTLSGALAGTPLGLCVNCSAPIATGIYHATRQAEAALALMVSSPTLNFIVITMSFALFPPYIAMLKIALSLLVILLIPLMVRGARLREVDASRVAEACALPAPDLLLQGGSEESWSSAVAGSLKMFLKSLRYVVVRTLPLMVLAGILGAVAVHTIPFASFAQSETRFGALVVASLFGTFLPAPMAFDVITAQTLLVAGLPTSYVMTLLFTLGAFSVYSFAIVWATISRQAAVALYAVVCVIGVGGGYAADAFARADAQRTQQLVTRIFQESVPPEAADVARSATPEAASSPGLAPPDPEAAAEAASETLLASVWKHAEIELSSRPHRTRTGPTGDTLFERREGPEFGLTQDDEFSPVGFLPPYRTGRGIASGDFDRDGWIDLVVATGDGPVLYRNRGAPGAQVEKLATPAWQHRNVFYVALVDIDDDGWLDLFSSSYRGDNVFYLNDRGRFDPGRVLRLEGLPESLAKAVSFADVDHDGDLDFYLGNWYHPGPTHGQPWVQNRNYLVIHEGGAFERRSLQEIPGVTQSVLFSDLDGDHRTDLVVSNDFAVPDFYFRGDGAGGFTPLAAGRQGIPESPRLSMSIDSGDIDNDLRPDLFLTNTGGSFESSPFEQRDFDGYCSEVRDPAAHARCERNLAAARLLVRSKMGARSFERCQDLEPTEDAEQCLAMALTLTAINREDRALCQRIPVEQASVRADCFGFFNHDLASDAYDSKPIPQARQRNVLLHQTDSGLFESVAGAWGVDNTEWSWTGKFGDFDNDGWQDLYIVNGRWGHDRQRIPNVFARNVGGRRFAFANEATGLGDYAVVSGFTRVDLDNDGDLDIVTNAINAPTRLYVNGEDEGHSITVELRDEQGNHYAIGSKVYIRYGADSEAAQVREMKAGGGFVSFDAPVLHFGLGDRDRIRSIEVVWPGGERTRIDRELPANHHYRITRRSINPAE